MKLFFKRNAIFFITFAVAMTIMLAGFAVNGMFPFGDRQILVIDAWHQYYPFLLEYHEKLQNGGSLLYNHNIGLGVNFLLLGSYYTNSPLNLLSFFVPHDYITEFMMVATAMKIALAATFMAMLLHYLYRKRNTSLMVFGLLYGFSTYFMGYYWCIMWLDTVMLLPLIVLGMHKVLRGENEALYILTLAIAIISNYYIGYMVCLFIAIYYLYLCFTQYRPSGVANFVSQSFYMLFYSILGVALSAFVLLPTIRGMELASSAKFVFPKKLRFERDFMTVIHRMLVGVKPEIVEVTGGLPNITAGTLSLYMIYLYFRCARVKLSEKIASFGMILFLLLSFMTNILNFVWHGFHYPNGIPFRFAFVFVFFVITLGYRAFHELEDFRPKHILSFMAIAICYLLYSQGSAVDIYVVLLTIVALLCYGALLSSYLGGTLKKRVFAGWLVALVVIESLAGAIYGIAVTGSSARSTYRLYGEDVASALAEMRRVDSGIYRTEMAKIYTTNDSSVYGFRGASVFSSTLNVNVTKFVRKLGAMGDGPSNRYSMPMSAPILDSLFNIKYFIGRNELAQEEYTGYTELGKWNYVRLMRNEYALPLGFYVPGSILSFDDSSIDPFVVQENLYSKMSGETVDCYETLRPTVTYENATATYDGQTRYTYTLTDSGQEGKVTVNYTFEEPGDYFIYSFVPRSVKDKATFNIVQGKDRDPREVQDYDVRRGIIIPTGKIEAGGNFQLDFKLEKGNSGNFDFVLVKGDHREFKSAFDRINSSPLELTKFEDTKIEGKIVAPDKGYVFLSLPFEKGWTAKVNGSPVLVTSLKNAMTLVPVSKGVNRIELSYFPDGLRGGLIISGFALASVLIITVFGKKLHIGYRSHSAADARFNPENGVREPMTGAGYSGEEITPPLQDLLEETQGIALPAADAPAADNPSPEELKTDTGFVTSEADSEIDSIQPPDSIRR